MALIFLVEVAPCTMAEGGTTSLAYASFSSSTFLGSLLLATFWYMSSYDEVHRSLAPLVPHLLSFLEGALEFTLGMFAETYRIRVEPLQP